MRSLKIALLATAATVALSSATLAADLIIADPMVIDNMSSFDWDGPYAGLWVSGQTTPVAFGLGADLGVNVVADNVLFGVEGDVAWLSNSSWTVQAHAKLGWIADTTAFYVFAGKGANSLGGGYVPLGVGAEFAVADNMSLKAEYQYEWGTNAHVGKLGFNWHF
jgi:opacity protein-like surface antigen